MNIKKSLAGLFAGFALLGAIAAPAALAQESGTQTVTIADGGAFNAYFCALSGSNVVHSTTFGLTLNSAPTASTAGNASGDLGICYLDTVSNRGSFDTKLDATTFTSVSTTTPIASTNYFITYTSAVGQTQQNSTRPSGSAPIGDIGYYKNEMDPNGQGAGATWSTGFSLDVARKVHFAYGGRGTIASGGLVSTSLTIPAGTAAGTYVSNLTITILPAAHP